MAARAEVEAVVAVLKKRFTNLTAEDVIALAYDILEALGRG